jgi:hypothetical protein
MRKPTKKTPTAEPGPVSAPAQWHRKLAAVTGQLSLAIVRRSITKGQLQNWSQEIKEVLEAIDAFAARPR